MSYVASKFCSACGNSLIETVVICPSCGSPTPKFIGGPGSANLALKSKTAAFLLAVFLGPWTWLYTFKVDQAKFWVWLGGLILVYVFFFSMPLGVITPFVYFRFDPLLQPGILCLRHRCSSAAW